MTVTLRLLSTALLASVVVISASVAQQRTVGVIHREAGAFDGYTFFAPRSSTVTYLVDMDGRIVNTWKSDYPATNPAYLLENGNMLRAATFGRNISRFGAGGTGARVEEFDWDGNLVWAYELFGDEAQLHHDVEMLPNGNILMTAWEFRTQEQAISHGRDTTQVDESGLWPEMIIEVAKDGPFGGRIVWEWHAWDHVIQDFDPSKANFGVVAEHPELIDLNMAAERGANWIHINGLDYNADLDQIIVSARGHHELWIIDHSTTTAEAAGHSGGRYGRGGDLLYRWGNPQAYRSGTADDQQFFGQHDAHWIEPGLAASGDLLVFNNGFQRPAGRITSIIELDTPRNPDGSYALPGSGMPFLPAAPVSEFTTANPTDLYSQILGNAQRLPSGNTLICDCAHGTLLEVTPAGDEVWRYVNPVLSDTVIVAQYEEIPDVNPAFDANTVFRAYRYGADYPGLVGRDLTPGLTIEETGGGVAVEEPPDVPSAVSITALYPNPFSREVTIVYETDPLRTPHLIIADILGRTIFGQRSETTTRAQRRFTWDGTDSSGRPVASGVYVVRVSDGEHATTRKLLLVR